MIGRLIQSAFETGCLSVASEALIHQIVEAGGCSHSDLDALQTLMQAVESGRIQREAKGAYRLQAALSR